MRRVIEQFGLTAIAVLLFAAIPAAAQRTSPVEPPEKPAEYDKKAPEPKPYPMAYAYRTDGSTSEKAIAVDSSVNISMCVTSGNLKINGWNRSELRVFVKDGAKFGFKVQQTSPKTGTPVWVMLNGMVQTAGKSAPQSECIWGDEIEIEVPVGANVNIKGQEAWTTIDSVRKVGIRMIGGDINLRNVSNGIMASAGQGDITVDESMGPMSLDSTTGNIVVFEAGPSEVGDIFKAKTNSGAVSMQKLQYRQIEVNSISGSVAYAGEILNGGTYGLSTSNGSIRLTVPQASKYFLIASYGFGAFQSDLPVKTIEENITPGPVKSIKGTINGGGDATLKLTTNNGSITIKKQ